MNKDNNSSGEQERVLPIPTLLQSLIPIFVLVICLVYGISFLGADPHIPLAVGSCAAAIVGVAIGFKWAELEVHFLKTINLAMQACLILMVIGCLIASWILSGTVPAMIFYGLKILSPAIFLSAACIMCSIVAISTGSSWTTAGTIGVALIGIGTGLGIPDYITAGAIVSGAYFGDKMSPLSDTTNLAPAMAGTTLFEHIRHMIYTTGPSLLISLVLYTIIGFKYRGSELDQSQINSILGAISGSFTINLFLLIPPVLVILMVVKKTPAIPGLVGGVFLGAIFFLLFQGKSGGNVNDTMNTLIDSLQNGYVSTTGHELVDELLSRGGMQSMMWTVSLILCAMIFGGIMERIGALAAITSRMLVFAKSTGSLVTVTVISCIFINVIASDQYLSIVIPGRMYKDEYRKRGLHPKNLSRVLEDAGTITSPFFVWNTCGAFMYTALGVHPFAYAPYAFLNWMNPLISIFYGFTGITMEKLPAEELAKIAEENKMASA